MGCTQSKIENEEAVSRCKERKQFMKLAVSARNAFAAAHSAYVTSLRSAGAALSDFAEGEVPHPQFPAAAGSSAAGAIPAIAAAAATQSFDIKPPPPPPDLTPLQRASTMPEKIIKNESKRAEPMKKQDIKEEEIEDEDVELENEGSLRTRRRRNGRIEEVNRANDHRDHDHDHGHGHGHDHVHAMQNSLQNSTMEYLFPSMENVPGTSLKDAEEMMVGKEEDDHHHHHHHLNKKEEGIQRKVFEEKGHGGMDDDGDGGGGVDDDEPVAPLPVEEVMGVARPPPVPEAMAMAATPSKAVKKVVKQVPMGSVEGKRSVKQSVNLMQVFSELDDHFLKASESAHEVSKMLEATRLHYHSNFADNRGHIDHSARVMRVITWNRSFRGIPNLDDGKDDVELEEHETHATVLDKLLAWEKKLYDEVKAGELMKYGYQKKVSYLNKLKNRSANSDALEKAKAAVSHLHTRYIVDMQSLDSTVSEISRLRDQQLYPRLVELVNGMANMWGIMQQCHERQSSIVMTLRLLDISQSPTETSTQHHEHTYQLLVVVRQWLSNLEKLMSHQREYIRALNSWLKQNLIPIESNLKEKVSSPPRIRKPPIQNLLIAWQDHLEKLPDEVARTAITNFAAVIETICHHQDEEIALKRKCEETRKELDRKTRQFEDWYNKYMQKKIPDELDLGRTEGNNAPDEAVTDKKFLVDQVKIRLEEEEDAYARKCLQVRQKSLGSLKNGLPELFRTMTSFSHESSKMYSELRSISQNQSSGQGSS